MVPGGSGGGIPGSGGCTGLALRCFSGRGLAKRQLNQPARRISLRSASARLNSTRTTSHASALHRVRNITRRTRLMSSQGSRGGRRSLRDQPARVDGVAEADRRQITAGRSNAIDRYRVSPSGRLPQHGRCNRFSPFLGRERVTGLPVLAVAE